MDGENKFDPTEIPKMISTFIELYESKRQPTGVENSEINKFFMRYMSKAMADCQAASSSHWLVARAPNDVALNFKTVDVVGETKEHVTQFVVATTACMVSDLAAFDLYKKNTTDAILDNFEDNAQFKTIFNKMAFNGSNELAQRKRTLVRGLWIGVRLSMNHFQPVDIEIQKL